MNRFRNWPRRARYSRCACWRSRRVSCSSFFKSASIRHLREAVVLPAVLFQEGGRVQDVPFFASLTLTHRRIFFGGRNDVLGRIGGNHLQPGEEGDLFTDTKKRSEEHT